MGILYSSANDLSSTDYRHTDPCRPYMAQSWWCLSKIVGSRSEGDNSSWAVGQPQPLTYTRLLWHG